MQQPNAEPEPERTEGDQAAVLLGDVVADWILAGQAIGDWPGIQ